MDIAVLTTELPGFVIERTGRKMKQNFARILSAHGVDVTVDQWVILQTLAQAAPLNQNQIAEKSFKDAPTVTRILDLLEKRGMIKREPDLADRRCFVICITQKGNDAVKQVDPLIKSFRKKAYAGLSNDNLEALKHTLNTILTNLQ